MQININSVIDNSLEATDGEIGKITSFYFDDNTWTIRYMVVKTGSWLSERKVLISPEAILTDSGKGQTIRINLTKEKVSSSPDIDTEKPVSRQQEQELFNHYPWKNYFGGGFYVGGIWGITYPASSLDNTIIKKPDTVVEQPEGDQHLRSTAVVGGYNIHATDGDIGHIKDFIVDDQTWKLSFFVVDTHNWFGGKKVLIPVSDIKEVQWDNSKVIVNINMDAVINSKLFNESEFMHMESNKL
jgi:uncharacterized protein YrrD